VNYSKEKRKGEHYLKLKNAAFWDMTTPHSIVISQKTAFFIVTTVKTSDLTGEAAHR
jgi:hypothetical protein